MWLDPRRFNLHQIHAASENGCALLDIMIPPYNKYVRSQDWLVCLLLFVLFANNSGLVCLLTLPTFSANRDCHHFKILEERYQEAKNERIVKMIESITADNHNEPSVPMPPSPSSQSS